MVSSVPVVEHEEHGCARVCHFAIDMFDALAQFNRRHPGRKLNLRVGINEGPVVAGVVGTKRFLFDLWGDTVNTASRMESTGVPGKIQVTKTVADLVKDTFVFESRGTVQVKGKGEMEVFVLNKRKQLPRFSANFLHKQEQLRRERDLMPDLPGFPVRPDMFENLRGSVSEISNSFQAINLKEILKK
jgi:class 3 adenylate cyclase